MSKITRVFRCNNCGVVLQSDDDQKPGFIPSELFDDKRDRVLYCEDCYRNLQININLDFEKIDHDILKVLDDAVASDALICFIVDLFSFNGTIDKTLADKIKNNNILVVGNKRDLFSENVKDESLIQYLKERFEAVGIKPVDIILVSATKNYNIEDFTKKLAELRKRHDVYLIGSSLSGKSAIIDVLLKVFQNKSKRMIKSENYPDTRLRILSIPFDNSSTLYEIPGSFNNDSVQMMVEKDISKYITPKKNIVCKRERLSNGSGFIVGGLAYLSLLKGASINVEFCFAENVELRKVNNSKIDGFFELNFSKRYVRPVSEKYQDFHDFDLFDIVLNKKEEDYDIAIRGLGWMKIKSKGQTIRVMLPRGASLTCFKSRTR